MKRILIAILLALAMPVFAGVTQLCATATPAVPERKDINGNTLPARDAGFEVTAYGLLPNGRASKLYLTTTDEKAKKTDVENCAIFDLPRGTVRFWLFFNSSGTITKADFQLEDTFDSKVFDTFDSQSITKTGILRAWVEAQ